MPHPTTAERFRMKTRTGPTVTEELGPCLDWIGALTTAGYSSFWFGGKVGYGHIYAWQEEHGPVPPGRRLDHRCSRRHCVRRSHLRLATGKQNGEHRGGPNRNNTTGYRGVYLDRRTGLYYGQVMHHGKAQNIPRHKDPAVVAQAVQELRVRLFGDFA